MICYCLPTRVVVDDELLKISSFGVSVVKDDKFRLSTDLPGKLAEDGKTFRGSLIIPAEFVNSAVIGLSGSIGNSSRGGSKTLRVRDFKMVTREKCWTEQK